MTTSMPAKNTDKEIWRRDPDDAFSPSIHVTESGAIGMNVNGMVIVMPVEEWHRLGRNFVSSCQTSEIRAVIDTYKCLISCCEKRPGMKLEDAFSSNALKSIKFEYEWLKKATGLDE